MKAKDLKNSILQLAVQGKLVEQDPNDEPASVLIERIREDRAKLITEKKIKAPKGGESVIWRASDGSHYEKRIDTKGRESKPACIDDEIPFEIPDSWEWCRLGSLVTNRLQIKPSHTFCYIDIASIDNLNQCLSSEEQILTAEKAPSRARKPVEIGDVLYSTVRPYLHNACIIDKEFSYQPIASTGFAALVHPNGYSERFLLNYLISPTFDEYANSSENSKGVAYPAINDDRLYKALIPVPPSSEQCRIVKRVERLMPLVEEYGRLEDEREELDASLTDRLRKSVLHMAVQGKLVAQDPLDEPASELLERIREKRRQLIAEKKLKVPKGGESIIYRASDGGYYEKRIDTKGRESKPACIDDEIPFEIPDSWEWCRLESILSLNSGLGYKKDTLAIKEERMVRIFRGGNISKNNRITIAENDTMIAGSLVDDSLMLKRGQIITPAVTSLENVGKAALVESDLTDTVCGGFVFFLTPTCDNLLNSTYLWVYLTSPNHVTFCKEHVKKSGQAFYNLSKASLNSALIAVPPLAEQCRIVERVEMLTRLI